MEAHAELMTATMAMTDRALSRTVWTYSADGSRRTGVLPGDALSTTQRWCARCRWFHPKHHMEQCPVAHNWQHQERDEFWQRMRIDHAWEMMGRRLRWEEKQHDFEHSTFCPTCGVTVQQPGECMRCDRERGEK